MPRNPSKTLTIILRFIFSMTILGAVLYRINWNEMSRVLSRGDYAFLFLSFVLYLTAVFLQGVRWHIFLKSDNDYWPFWKIQSINFISFFHELYTPAKLGSDAYRIIFFRGHRSVHHVATSLFALRLQGLTINIFAGCLGLLILMDMGQWKISALFAYSFLVLLACMIAKKVLANLMVRHQVNGLSQGFREKILLHLIRIAKAFDQILSSFSTVITSSLTGFAFVGIAILTYACVGAAFQIQVPFTDYLFGVPVLLLAAMIPITIHGRGLTELLALYLWQGTNATQEQIVLMCLAVYMLLVVQGLLGGLLWIVLRTTVWYQSLGVERFSKSCE